MALKNESGVDVAAAWQMAEELRRVAAVIEIHHRGVAEMDMPKAAADIRKVANALAATNTQKESQ